MKNDVFMLVFASLGIIFILGAIVNAIRNRVARNRREARQIMDKTGAGTEDAPVKLDNPFAKPSEQQVDTADYVWR